MAIKTVIHKLVTHDGKYIQLPPGMGSQAMGDRIPLRMGGGEVVQGAGHMQMALDGLESVQHGQRVVQALMVGIEPDLICHAGCEPCQVNGQEFVEVDGLDQALIERVQHRRRNQRDTGRAFSPQQWLDVDHAAYCCSKSLMSAASSAATLP